MFWFELSLMIFQSVIESVLQGLTKVGVFIDDIIIGGVDLTDCECKVHQVLSRLNEYNIKVNFDKSNFLLIP